MPKTIVVTGATGNVAQQLIPLLETAGVKVRAVVHNKDKGAAMAARGIEVVEGDLSRPRTIEHAFDGADALMSIVPNGPLAPQQASSAFYAARQAGVKHVVRLSAVGAAHDAPTVNSRLHALSDAELERSNVPFTILRPHFFMQNYFMSAPTVASDGAMYWALGEGRMGVIDVADVAAVAAKILVEPKGHEGKAYLLTGPRSITTHEVAAAFAEAVGKPVKYVPVSIEQADQAMAGFGMDEYIRTVMTDYMTAYARNWGDVATDEVQKILGRPPRSIAEFARSVASAFGKR